MNKMENKKGECEWAKSICQHKLNIYKIGLGLYRLPYLFFRKKIAKVFAIFKIWREGVNYYVVYLSIL